MNIKSMRVRSYRSIAVDEYVPSEPAERYRTLKAYESLGAAACSEEGALAQLGISRHGPIGTRSGGTAEGSRQAKASRAAPLSYARYLSAGIHPPNFSNTFRNDDQSTRSMMNLVHCWRLSLSSVLRSCSRSILATFPSRALTTVSRSSLNVLAGVALRQRSQTQRQNLGFLLLVEKLTRRRRPPRLAFQRPLEPLQNEALADVLHGLGAARVCRWHSFRRSLGFLGRVYQVRCAPLGQSQFLEHSVARDSWPVHYMDMPRWMLVVFDFEP